MFTRPLVCLGFCKYRGLQLSIPQTKPETALNRWGPGAMPQVVEKEGGNRSIASPICQEGQSEITFMIFPLFSPFFLIFGNFFAVKGGTLPLDPQWLCHCPRRSWLLSTFKEAQGSIFQEMNSAEAGFCTNCSTIVHRY